MMNRIFFLIAIAVSFSAVAQNKNEQYYLQGAPFKMPAVVEPTFASQSFSIKDFCALGDGQT
jgi:hypothetical protein